MYIKYIRGNGCVPQGSVSKKALFTVRLSQDAAGAPFCSRHTKIDCSDALKYSENNWLISESVHFIFVVLHILTIRLEADVRLILDGKKKSYDTYVTGLVTLNSTSPWLIKK